MMMTIKSWLFLTLWLFVMISMSSSTVINIASLGAIMNDSSTSTCFHNTNILNEAFNKLVKPNDTVLVPQNSTYYIIGGVYGNNLYNITFEIQGTLKSSDDYKAWPLVNNRFVDIVTFYNCSHLRMVGDGLIDGQGLLWWDLAILGKLPDVDGRPHMILIHQSKYITILNLNFHNSPSWHLEIRDCAHVEVGYITVYVDRRGDVSSSLQPEDLNTDGIDPSGNDFWIHDCTIINDDDSIAVKPCDKTCISSSCSQNMLIERLNLTGFGASIGSVPPSTHTNCVRNITFRNILMPKTGKGIYIKSNPTCNGNNNGIIENILYENITILEPRWWSIWIGPQQQHEPGQSLGRKCALDYPLDDHCPTQGCVTFKDIYLKNVFVHAPWLSPGVILGNSTNPMINITFDNVIIDDPGLYPFHEQYQCTNVVNSSSIHGTRPIPPCVSHTPGLTH